MSLIIDANCLASVFSTPTDAEFLAVVNALFAGSAKLALGGTKLRREYLTNGNAIRSLRVLDQAAKLIQPTDSLVDAEEAVLNAMPLQSDDPHILALARVSGARLLCSHDQALHRDFTNRQFINPRGSVYQVAAHSGLIRRHCAND